MEYTVNKSIRISFHASGGERNTDYRILFLSINYSSGEYYV